MLLRKEGFPEDEELVLCTVTKVLPNSVFVELDEYGKGGMIHISEVSPGRIRNIRDFVVEGKKVVCKVLRTDKERGHIDLSLRRVNAGQKKDKLNEIKQEQKSEKIIEIVSKKLNTDVKKLYEEISKKVFEKYYSLFSCFEDIIKGNVSLEKLGIDKKTADVLTELVKDRMKPQEVYVEGELKIKSYAPDGVEIVKDALKKGVKEGSISFIYEGGGNYILRAKSTEYKDAEKLLDKSSSAIISYAEQKGAEATFNKKE